MKILILLVTIFGIADAQAQLVRTEEKEMLEPVTKGTCKEQLVLPAEDPVESVINYQYFGFPDEPYEKQVNQLIYDYVKTVAMDTLFIGEFSKTVSRDFFKAALRNFLESYNYVRFKISYDVPAYWLHTDIVLDTVSLKQYIQFKGESAVYTGGAHPFLINEYKMLDKKSAKVVEWIDLLADSSSFMTVAEKYFRKTEKLKENQDYSSYFFESGKFEHSQNFYFTKNKLVLIYLPYEAREWARGMIYVEIPKGKIKKYLNINW